MSNQSHLTVHSADPTPSTDSALQAATGRLIRQNGPDGLFGRLAVSKAPGIGCLPPARSARGRSGWVAPASATT
jgi:hypothetical protein